MLGEVNLSRVDVECGGHFLHRPLAQHVEFKYLELLGADLAFDLFRGGTQLVLLPLLLPAGVEVECGRIGDAIDCGGGGAC